MECMSPIPSLPTEIVIRIILSALRRVIDENGCPTTILLNFSLVSRRWRDVVQTASDLWTDINLHWSVEQQQKWLERSSPRGIDVHALTEPEDWFEATKYAMRLRSLRLLSVPLRYLEQFLGCIETSDLNKLESIHLECHPYGSGMAIYDLPLDFADRAPYLRTISLSVLRITNLHIVAHQLTHLEIFSSTHASEDLMLTLSLCVNLEHLSLGGVFVHGPYEYGPIIMPRLQTLLLQPHNTARCVQLILGVSQFGPPLGHFRAPQLLCLYVWYDGECDVRFTDAISDFIKESPRLSTLGIAGCPMKGPVPALANLAGMGRPPRPPVALSLASESSARPSSQFGSPYMSPVKTNTMFEIGIDPDYDHFDRYGSQTPMRYSSQHSNALLAPGLRHLCLDMFVPVYNVMPGDRYHSLVMRFLDFRASVRDEKIDRPALRRLTLQGWSNQGLAEIARSYTHNDIIIDANMSGGLLPASFK